MWGAVVVLFMATYYAIILPMMIVNEKRKRETNTMLHSSNPYLLSISRTIEEV